MAQTVVSNYQIDKSCRLVREKLQFGQSKTPGVYLGPLLACLIFSIFFPFRLRVTSFNCSAGKYKVSVCIQLTTSKPVIKSGTADINSKDADLHLELAVVVDWKTTVEPDPSGAEPVDMVRTDVALCVGANI
jgi:hypothetical protein